MGVAGIVLLLASCYSNNCPLENTVLCNYSFYDAEGNAVNYGDTITVTTLMPSNKTEYVYRKLGNPVVIKYEKDAALVEQGYTETAREVRNDTILVNQLSKASSMKIPMSYFNKIDTLILSYKRITLKDTIKNEHSSYPHVEQPECGTYRFHTLENISATDAAIDHIEISNAQVNYEGNVNVKIYFNGSVED